MQQGFVISTPQLRVSPLPLGQANTVLLYEDGTTCVTGVHPSSMNRANLAGWSPRGKLEASATKKQSQQHPVPPMGLVFQLGNITGNN